MVCVKPADGFYGRYFGQKGSTGDPICIATGILKATSEKTLVSTLANLQGVARDLNAYSSKIYKVKQNYGCKIS